MTPIPLIVDTDGGLDDALALRCLAGSSSVRLLCVHSVHGNVSARSAAHNAARALELASVEVPVVTGASDPLAQPLSLRHPEDVFAALAGPPTHPPAEADLSVESLLGQVRDRPGEIDVLALGPLTNLARALRDEPELPRLVRRLVAMAGVFDIPGNITEHAESNVYHDPEAAAEVLSAGFRATLVPLDVTLGVTADRTWLGRLAELDEPMWSKAASVLLAAGTALPPLPLHDPTAAALLLNSTLATASRTGDVRVTLEGAERGRTELDVSPTGPTTVITGLDQDRVRAALLNALT